MLVGVDEMGRACDEGDTAAVARLLAAGRPVDEPVDDFGTTPLLTASTVAVVELLLAAGVSVATGKYGEDALGYVLSADSALRSQDERIAAGRLLIVHGARLDHRNTYTWPRLYRAAFAVDPGAVDALLALGAPAEDDPPPLAAAVWGTGFDRLGTARIVDALVAAGADPTHRDEHGWSVLHGAAMPYSHGDGFESSDGPNLAAIERLLAHGVAVDVEGPGRTTALMLVAGDGNEACTSALLAAGADRRRRDGDGRTALDRARALAAMMEAYVPEAEHPENVRRIVEDARACIHLLERGG